MNSFALNWLIAGANCLSGGEIAGWTVAPAIVAPLLLTGLLYGFGVCRLWSIAGIGHGASLLQAGCFAAGWLLLGAALVSPLHALSLELFWVHMVEHEVLMAAAAPLLVLSRPLGVMLWACPKSSRRRVARSAQVVAFLLGWDVLTRPLVATTLHAVAIWVWHVPPLFDAALVSEPLHWLQHLSFFVTALLFWWAMLERRGSHGAAVVELFATAMHTGFLGALLAVAPRPMYPLQSQLSLHFGLDPLTDQQLAGLIMWIPAGTVYVGAALAIAWRWIEHSGRGAARSLGGENATSRR